MYQISLYFNGFNLNLDLGYIEDVNGLGETINELTKEYIQNGTYPYRLSCNLNSLILTQISVLPHGRIVEVLEIIYDALSHLELDLNDEYWVTKMYGALKQFRNELDKYRTSTHSTQLRAPVINYMETIVKLPNGNDLVFMCRPRKFFNPFMHLSISSKLKRRVEHLDKGFGYVVIEDPDEVELFMDEYNRVYRKVFTPSIHYNREDSLRKIILD